MAMVAIAPGMFLAHSVVPSSGSTAMSTSGPCLLPTFSPMNSMGASSRSPSPITIVPLMGSLLSSRRMASTAAWSAAFSLPRPVNRAADTAARSVTRTISSVRTRSKAMSAWMLIDDVRPSLLMLSPSRAPGLAGTVSVFLDPDDLRLARDHLVAADRGERFVHCILGGGVSDQDDRNRLAGAPRCVAALRPPVAMPLHDRFQRDVLLGEPLGDGGGGARLIHSKKADVVAAFMALHRRFP